jgi:hypothetical protein
VNQGSLCALGQASIGRSYHPDRFKGPLQRGAGGQLEPISWEQATALLAEKLKGAGGRVRAISGSTGPTLGSLFDRFLAAVGSAGGRLYYESFGYEALREASRAVFGAGVRPIFDLEGADFVIDFGAESLESWLARRHARQIEGAREVTSKPAAAAARYVGPRLRSPPGMPTSGCRRSPATGILALGTRVCIGPACRGSTRGGDPALLEGILAGFDAESVALRTAVPAETIARVGRALAQAKRPAALPPGVALTSRRATATAAAVLILDAVVGAIGETVLLPTEASAPPEPASFRDVLELVAALQSGDVAVLLLHGGDPVYSLPPGAGFVEALGKVGFVVSFASIPDETSEQAHLILPDNTPLESWGDAAVRASARWCSRVCGRCSTRRLSATRCSRWDARWAMRSLRSFRAGASARCSRRRGRIPISGRPSRAAASSSPRRAAARSRWRRAPRGSSSRSRSSRTAEPTWSCPCPRRSCTTGAARIFPGSRRRRTRS